MSTSDLAVTWIARRAAGLLLVLAMAASAKVAQAQVIGGGYGRTVGGISINAEGLLNNASVDDQGQLRRVVLEALQPVPDGMKQPSGQRKVSLRKLDAAIQKTLADGKPLADVFWCLAGLQKIRYILAVPEQNDIILVGQGEGWKVDQRGNLVGATSGRPVLLLDDLLVALRAALSPNRAVITCSIDPTPEGIARVSRISRKLSAADPQGAAAAIERELGPQKITFTGVPETSHFARVLVAADYRMKRISMDLEPAPIAGLPGFMQMMKGGGAGMSNMLPRWWLAPDYQPLVRDPDGLAWELRGTTVKAMAENDYVNARGQREKTAAADPASQRWADTMTRRYEDLARAEPVFAELRNCMDLAVVGAVIARGNLLGKAGCTLPMLTDAGALSNVQLPAPKQIASKASPVHKGRKWMVAAGGVEINPWTAVENAQTSEQLSSVRTQAAAAKGDAWWWD